FLGDRTYSYVIDHATNPHFPWMTARQAAQMLIYKPKIMSSGEIDVETPEGFHYSLSDTALEESLEAKFGYSISLKHRETGCHDAKPISLLGLQTIEELEKETGIQKLAPERFRANIYADWNSRTPFLEDGLVGKKIVVGANVILKIAKKDSRCVIPTLDPATSKANPDILETIKEKHAGCFGVYAEVVSGGIIHQADIIAEI
ncbi:MAG TPA: MOSC domain-containing protein, partial [Nitrososphaerales archaeon]|nr:MOSC domain-containing protein [Nitrososphaerales archaeon]